MFLLSLPMRGAWIEMNEQEESVQDIKVAPHAGGVD